MCGTTDLKHCATTNDIHILWIRYQLVKINKILFNKHDQMEVNLIVIELKIKKNNKYVQ